MESKAPGALCHQCSLRNQPFVPSSGCMDPDAIIVVGEAPGLEEVRQQAPFVGQTGQLLKALVENAGGNFDRLYRTNVVACRPPSNRDPFPEDVAACKGRLFRELEQHPSKTVLSLGKFANELLIEGYNMSDRGVWHKSQGKDVLPAMHPAYVLRKPGSAKDLQRDVRVVLQGYQPPQFAKPPRVVHLQTVTALQNALATVPPGMVAFDIETDNVNWYDRPGKKADAVLCLMFAWSDEFGIVIDDMMLYDVPGTIPVLQEFFNRKELRFCAHNAQFDLTFLQHHFGLYGRCDFDTMLAHYLLDENSRHGLKLLAKEEFGLLDYEAELIKQYLRSQNDQYSKIPFDKLAQYGIWDVVVTRALAERFEQRLKDEGMYDWPFMNILMPAQRLFIKMWQRGMSIDVEYMKYSSGKMLEELDRIASKARELVGVPTLNMNSPTQLSEIIYGQLNMPQPTSYKIKRGSTAHAAIEPMKGMHPFVDLLLRYRRIAKIRSSYLENVLGYVDVNGLIHPEPDAIGTEVGRIAVRDPAAQTIPRPGRPDDSDYDPYLDGALVRGSFVSSLGNKLLIVDYSQAELRAAACYSKEPYLIEAYRNDEDLHTKVALGMYGSDFTKEQRVRCKMFNFSYLYGGSEYSFAQDAGLPIGIAKQFVSDYNRLMPRLAEFRSGQYEKLLADGYVQSIFGRKRRFLLITDDNKSEARKSAMHAPIAGTASDLTLLSAIEADNDGVDVRLLVHDSILAESPDAHAEETTNHIAETMRKIGETYMEDVPWKTDAEISTRWAKPPQL